MLLKECECQLLQRELAFFCFNPIGKFSLYLGRVVLIFSKKAAKEIFLKILTPAK